MRPRGARLVAGLTVGILAGVLSVSAAGSAHAAVTGQVRVDQVGFLPGETKQAYLMTTGTASGVTFAVINSAGSTVLSGNVGSASRGSWNTNYPDVYPIDFSSLTAAGTYHIQVSGGVSASSPSFTVQSASSLYGGLVSDGVSFFQTQRDGPNVIPGPLNRQPSHLNDASASVYAHPHFASGGSDTITDANLTKIGGPVDVSGGWFDAGDYLKFTMTTAYADSLLFAAQRALGSAAPTSLAAEAHFGVSWLNKMWNQSTKTLYMQVGIGSGNSAGTFLGDHDLWRLPEADDSDTSSADRFAAAHRPVFEAASPGTKISPNLAGRVAAAFALAAQVDATSNPTQAAAEYQAAISVYAQANTTSPPSTLVTTLPNSYYTDSSWHEDMEFGAAEIALAAQALGHDPSTYLSQAATWASQYIASDTGDTFNLYDPSALAHADLIQAMDNAGDPAGLAVTRTELVNDLKRQLTGAATVAASDIFHAGGDYTNFDVDSHTFGLVATEALYQKVSGDTSFASFATQQRNWLLGANAWGTSFMVGEGTTFPHCMQSQMANLAGSTNGSAPIDIGAVVNGPNGASNFSGGLGGYQSGMVACPPGGSNPFKAFDGHNSRWVDDVRSWQTDEPALDMTGTAVLGAALQQSLSGSSSPNDFSLSLSPNSGTVTAGQSATSTVSTAVTAGSAESVTLSAAGLPSGATASFGTSPVTSGGGSALTIATTSSTPAGTYRVTVTGTASSGSHTATYTLTVASGSGGCTAAQLLGNPGFENGATNTAPWVQSSTLGFDPVTAASTAEPAHSGGFVAWFNGNGSADTDTEAQTVTIPVGCTTATLSLWLHIDTTENTTTATPDTFKVQLLNSAGTVLTTLATFSNLSHNTGYTQHSYNVSSYIGQTVTLKFTGTETDTNGGTTNFVLDDTALNVN
ncbi:MAG TPA: glycoside hydrolase family 9 protein [Streptosporangiaceae bacterium]|nr:glycoside hydrolase family 9 protein [Streptosporangiaceae bacterium]